MQNTSYPTSLWQLCLAIAVLCLLGCDGCDTRDRIIFTNAGNGEIGLMVDGANTSGLFTDQEHIHLQDDGNTFFFAEDILARNYGEDQVVAFSWFRPPVIVNNPGFDEGLDIIAVNFPDRIELDFTVWVIHTGGFNTFSNRINEINDGFDWCDQYWASGRMGLITGRVDIVDARNDGQANNLRDCSTCDDDYFADLRNDIGYDPGRINIYLTRQVEDSRSKGKTIQNGDQILLGSHTGEVDALLHQITHAFSLEHTDNLAGFYSKSATHSTNNLLTRRKFLSQGQSFRAHAHPESAINDTYQARPGGFTISCPHSNNGSLECPELRKSFLFSGELGPAF